MESAAGLAMETSKVESAVRNQAEAKLNQLEHSEPAGTMTTSCSSRKLQWIQSQRKDFHTQCLSTQTQEDKSIVVVEDSGEAIDEPDASNSSIQSSVSGALHRMIFIICSRTTSYCSSSVLSAARKTLKAFNKARLLIFSLILFPGTNSLQLLEVLLAVPPPMLRLVAVVANILSLVWLGSLCLWLLGGLFLLRRGRMLLSLESGPLLRRRAHKEDGFVLLYGSFKHYKHVNHLFKGGCVGIRITPPGGITPIRSTTEFETPSSACTRRPDEICADGFSSSNWPERISGEEGGGGGGVGRRPEAAI
ncbi:Zgc:56443 protein (ISS) [Dorcoceras hygrometricum]|uniref:Zgc:56443 protein (ISS) n=1 Tax=Dorcoceras hygrometricum TaxID=472368 RepID=A0A2Z7AEV0_9LAMI|nr:Zgc:56443 protein (ISS) [Dorcoceras hygrometricum]